MLLRSKIKNLPKEDAILEFGLIAQIYHETDSTSRKKVLVEKIKETECVWSKNFRKSYGDEKSECKKPTEVYLLEMNKAKKEEIEIKDPLKDFHIFQNEYDIKIKKGEPVSVTKIFKTNLITEGVIKE